ncbi:hypothetical protein C5167_007543 [Papaver somniferum]|nr:hypothetical protein C5167_007543 [Papaver somniferum]
MPLEKMSFVPLIFPSDLLIGLVLIYEILTPSIHDVSTSNNNLIFISDLILI